MQSALQPLRLGKARPDDRGNADDRSGRQIDAAVTIMPVTPSAIRPIIDICLMMLIRLMASKGRRQEGGNDQHPPKNEINAVLLDTP